MNHYAKADELRLAVSSKSDRLHKSKLGQFFTPSSTARFMASLFQEDERSVCRLLDPGAGIAALSGAFLERCVNGELSFESIDITAYEIDPVLHDHLEDVLSSFDGVCGTTHRVEGQDFIEAAVNDVQFRQGPRFTHVIMNPPYKKINTASRERLLLRQVGIETVNLYSGFLGLALELLEEGGQLVAIVPRSWCNGPYYRPFREFILERAALTHIHVFETRNKAFKDDKVLQETVIVRLVKGQTQGDVRVSASTDDLFNDVQTYVHPFDQIVHTGDKQRFVHIPLEEEQSALTAAGDVFSHTLADLDIGVCTGPVVDFRLKESLRNMPEEGTVPLLYANHLRNRAVDWPIEGGKKPNAITVDEKSRKWLMPMGTYAVTRRFSSKEEKRRVVATVVDHTVLPDDDLVGFENHLNVYHRKKGPLPAALAHGLVIYLNSTAVDEHLRRFSGHTQVNATDLKKLPYPSEQALLVLGDWAIKSGKVSQEDIDARVMALTNET